MLMFTGCGNKGNSSDVTEGNSQSGNQNSVEGDNEPVTDVMARTDYQFINAYGYSASTSVRVDFGVINNCNLYAPGDEVTYFINISGKNLDGKAAKVNFFHKNFGVSKTFEHTIATDEKGKQTITGKLTTEKTYKNGVYTFECTVDGFDKELKFDIGIVPRAARANDDFYYGVQSYITRSKNTASHRLTHQGADDTTVSKFATADYMGCNMIREEVTNFGGMWSKKEDKIDPSVIESDIEIADKLGMTYLWLATGSPAWAIDSKYTDSEYQGWQLPPDADVWKKYINAIGKYYKDYDNIIFEIWNEADWEFFMGTKEDYFNLLDIAIKELTSVSNKIRILPSACVSGWELSKDGATHSKGRSFYFGHYLKYIKDGSLLGLNYHDHQLFNQKLIMIIRKPQTVPYPMLYLLATPKHNFKENG